MDQNRVENQVDEGTLQIHLTNASTGIPVKGAKISISYTGISAAGAGGGGYRRFWKH